MFRLHKVISAGLPGVVIPEESENRPLAIDRDAALNLKVLQ